MTRSELVAHYRIVFLEGGYQALWPLLEPLLYGAHHVHDPEWWECMECGAAFELPFNGGVRGGLRSQRSEFCTPCRQAHWVAAQRLKREWPGLVREAA